MRKIKPEKRKPAFITRTGVKLYLDDKMVEILNMEIKHKGLENVQAFLAIHENCYKEYVLVKDGYVFTAGQKAEDIISAIERLEIYEKFKNKEDI